MKNYDPELKLRGKVLITYKIDGVQALNNNGQITSRAFKPIYNVPDFDGTKAEIFLGTFKESIQATRTQKKKIEIKPEHIYILEPNLDPRLILATVRDPDDKTIQFYFKMALKNGYEGLVLYANNDLYKVKPVYTIDCKIVDIIPGKGKHLGRLGAFIVEYNGATFKVGTGLNDKDRKDYFNRNLIGKIIEVQGMEKLPSGKLRHPRFIRMRPDKI